MIRLLFLSLFLIGEVSGDCNCSYLNQTYSQSWPNFWLQNAFDGNNACETTNCTYWLDGGAGEGVGLYTRIQWDSTTNGYINIYNSDATRGKGTVIKLGIDNTFKSTPEASQGRYVLVEMVLTSPGNVLCTMGITTPVAPTATTVPPPPTTTTPPYNGTLSKNPALISNDLLIMVDQGQTNDINDFLSTKQFAAGVVNTIAPSVFGGVATVDSPVTGTRLSLNYLNYVNYGPAITPWADNSSDIANQILNLPPLQSKKTNFYTALNSLVDSSSPHVFNPANGVNADMNSRNTAQRVLLIVASSPPDSADDIYDINKPIPFNKYDIHPIFVAYNFDTTVAPFVNLVNMGFTIEAVNNTSEETINGFVEKYFLKNICNAPYTTMFSAETDSPNNVIQYGFTTSPGSTYTPDYAKNRYCNFQQRSYYVARPTPPTSPSTARRRYCFTVFYELEVEKDSLKFYQCNTDDSDCKGPSKYIEYVTLSGTDVDGSTFCFTNSTRIDFATNESGVYGGYSIRFALEPVAT